MAQKDSHRMDNTEDVHFYRKKSKRRKRTSAAKVLFWLVVMLAASGLLAIFLLRSANDVFGFNKPDEEIAVTIEEGMATSEIAELLNEKGIIDQPLTFRLYAKIRNRNGVYIAGNYVLNSNMSYDQLILAMRSGNLIKNEEVTITFYEGMTLSEIANLLEENEVCDALEFMEYLDSNELGYEFENMLPESDLRFRRLEGYLFPDTYDFYVGERVDSVAKKFVSNFQSRVFPELYEEILEAGMTLDEAITLASIIQKEAGNVDEMAMVSSVFHNRLENPSAGLPKLQSDVTIFYVEDDIKPYQTRSTQDIYDAYNTYTCDGLPVGPICSPGLDAIRAAIEPAESDYYYFVTDINGKYYYGRTLDEHNYNISIANSAGGVEHGTDID